MFEIGTSIINNIPLAAFSAITAGFLRSTAGWLENSLKDEKIDEFEIKQLSETVIKYFASVSLLMLGLPIEQAVAGTFVLDVGTRALKK